MTEFEKIEKLREKANVSYEEAKAALDEACGDLLDAIVLLEKQGKVKSESSTHSTRSEAPEQHAEKEEKEHNAAYAWDLFKKLLAVGNRHNFIISRKGRQIFSLSVTAVVILLLFTHVYLLIALAVGLFCGLRFTVQGDLPAVVQVNDMMDKAANAAENVRETVEDSLKNAKPQ